jgi:TPP-dependent pyruvate/acetoin dehydrogenase alpha subunit
VSVGAAPETDDVIASTHRPHVLAIAKVTTVQSLMRVLFGKPTGCCRAKAAQCT